MQVLVVDGVIHIDTYPVGPEITAHFEQIHALHSGVDSLRPGQSTQREDIVADRRAVLSSLIGHALRDKFAAQARISSSRLGRGD